MLDLEFRDNVKAHILQPDGTYVKPDRTWKGTAEFPDGILHGGYREGCFRQKTRDKEIQGICPGRTSGGY